MNSVEQVAGSYGRFSYDAEKKRSGAEITQDFEALIGGSENTSASVKRHAVPEHTDGEGSNTTPVRSGVGLYLYNLFGETTEMEPPGGVNVNKLV